MTKNLRHILEDTLSIIEGKLKDKTEQKYRTDIEALEEKAGLGKIAKELEQAYAETIRLRYSLKHAREEIDREDLEQGEKDTFLEIVESCWSGRISKFGKASLKMLEESIEFRNLKNFRALKKSIFTEFDLQEDKKSQREIIQNLNNKNWEELGIVLHKDCGASKIENGKLIL